MPPENSFKLAELFSIMTHIFIIPALVVAWRHLDYFGLTFFFIILTQVNSLLYHTCAFVGDDALCVYNFAQLQLMDHISAEMSILVVAILLLRMNRVYYRDLLMAFLAVLHLYLKLVNDNLWVVTGIGLTLAPFILIRSYQLPKKNPLLWIFLLILVGIGFLFYFMDVAYTTTHPMWHAAIFLAKDVVIIDLWRAEKNGEEVAWNKKRNSSILPTSTWKQGGASHDTGISRSTEAPKMKIVMASFMTPSVIAQNPVRYGSLRPELLKQNSGKKK